MEILTVSTFYPRVTQIIEETSDPEKRKHLIKWMKKMEKIHGIEGAKIEKQKILDNGTQLHQSIEKYLKNINEEKPHKGIKKIQTLLELIKLSPELIIEKRLYSNKYQFQGKPDCICQYQNTTTIIDWTTSGVMKRKEWLEHKFIQAGAYAIAVEECLNIQVKQLAVITIVEKPDTFQIFTESPEKWRGSFLNKLGIWKRNNGHYRN